MILKEYIYTAEHPTGKRIVEDCSHACFFYEKRDRHQIKWQLINEKLHLK